jgi:hypothetical protein
VTIVPVRAPYLAEASIVGMRRSALPLALRDAAFRRIKQLTFQLTFIVDTAHGECDTSFM